MPRHSAPGFGFIGGRIGRSALVAAVGLGAAGFAFAQAKPGGGTPVPGVSIAPASSLDPDEFRPLKLDERPFERPSAGISLHAPHGWTGVMEVDREEIVRFVDDLKKQDRSLVVTRRSFDKPQRLFAVKNPVGELAPGIMENTLKAMEAEYPGMKVLRAGDPTNIGAFDVGIIIVRYTKNGERRLAQNAIIQANDQLYYLIGMNTPARKDVVEDNNPEEKTVDPGEKQAVETFRKILDTVKLLDLKPIRDDQTRRLFTTRALYANLNDQKLSKSLIPERYVRILKDGKDVGYSYLVEGLGRPKEPKVDPQTGQPVETLKVDFDGSSDGLSVGIRTRMITPKDNADPRTTPFPREDSESWMYTSMDRRLESWTKLTAWDDDGKPKTPQNPWRKVSEIGASQMSTRRVAAVPRRENEGPEAQFQKGIPGDHKAPWVDELTSYSLAVQFKATRADLEPVNRPLPPFYLPQALGAMLPRLVPVNEPKNYLVATYVSEVRQVMLRYIDVKPAAPLPAELKAGAPGGALAIPIDDRIGFEGAITTHWMSPRGIYLGSITKSTGLIVLPVEEKELMQLWGVDKAPKLFELPADAERAARPRNPNAAPPARPIGPQPRPGSGTIDPSRLPR